MNDTQNNETLRMMQGQRMADPSEGGLTDALDRFFGDSQSPSQKALETPAEPPKQDPPKQDPPKQDPPKQEAPTEPEKKPEDKKEEPKKPVEAINIDEEFTMGEEKKETTPTESFDEKKFDQETENLAQGMDEKAGSKFKALRAELKEVKQKAITPDVQKKIEELELKAAETEGLRKRLDELSNVSAKIRMESTEVFEKEVKNKADNLFGEVATMAERYEGDPKFLWKIVTSGSREEQEKMINEHLSDFSRFDQIEVARMIKDWSGIIQRRNELLDEAQRHIDGLDAKKAEEAERILQENRRNVQTIQKDMWTKYKDVIPGFVDEDGNETPVYKDLMSRSMSLDFTRATARDQAFAAFSGVILKHLVTQMNEMRQQLAEYEGEDKRRVKATPKTGAAVNSTGSETREEKPQSFRELMANADLV